MPINFARELALSLFGDTGLVVHPDPDEYFEAFFDAPNPGPLERFYLTDDGLYPEFGDNHAIECAHCDGLVFAPTEALAIDLLEQHEHDVHAIDMRIPSLDAYVEYSKSPHARV